MHRQISLVLGMLVLICASPFTSREALAETGRVQVSASCPSGSAPFDSEVTPWVLEIAQDDDTEWELTISGSDDDTIIVEAKKRGHWPYKKDKYKAKKKVKNEKKMKKDAKGDYSYNVIVNCGGEEFVIDPRVKVN